MKSPARNLIAHASRLRRPEQGAFAASGERAHWRGIAASQAPIVLHHEFMEPSGLSARAVAQDIDVPVMRITEILNGERSVTADTALRLGRRFGTSPEFWLGL